jgi:hypothetical protein
MRCGSLKLLGSRICEPYSWENVIIRRVFPGGGFDQFVNHVNIHSLHFNIIGKAFVFFKRKKKIHALHVCMYTQGEV